MRYIVFDEAETYQTAVLIKDTAFNKRDIQTNYITPLNLLGTPSESLIAFTLDSDTNKTSVKFMKAYLDELLPAIAAIGVHTLYVADSGYFKVLTKQGKADPHFGYVLPCKIAGFETMNVVLGLNHQALIYNPDLQAKLDMSLKTLANSLAGVYKAIGIGIIHSAQYPSSVQSISDALDSLHQYSHLTADIEAFSLRFNEAGIGTCAFAWDQHNGVAFAVDFEQVVFDDGTMNFSTPVESMASHYGFYKANQPVRDLLRKFFLTYKGEITWHNSSYDIKVIVYTLFMHDLLDTEGLLNGLDCMTRSFQDTKIIAYLATNSTAGNVLGLKALAHEFAGNWAREDIKDIRRIPLSELLQYNLVDCLSAWFVKNKFAPRMVADKQEELYHSLMLPSLKVIIQMELTGMPMNAPTIEIAKNNLEAEQAEHLKAITDSPLIKVMNLLIQNSAMVAANAKLKTKQHPLEKYEEIKFNPNSGPQLQTLLYTQMGLPIIDFTDTKLPATGAETIKKLINHTQEPSFKALLTALIGFTTVSKILSTFIPAFEKGIDKADGAKYLHGNFNLGGTVSGRLSSSEPNLQNIPAKSAFAEVIKECFAAPEGWLFVGADFNSLEDYVSALTTRDPNKLKVYLDGYDGHCLRAFSYFPEKCPDIVDTVASINSMKKLYPDLRQDSKGPTFALTYQGTWHTLVNNLGFEVDAAKDIERGYHSLYAVSDQYVQDRLKQASEDGYVEVAFGLRVRTPLLKQVVFGSSRMPYEASAEGRTAGNALGQSYGLLNNRAANAFMQKVWASKYRLDIKPVALIHDAIYLIVKDNAEVVEWVNRELILAMQWQELDELKHDTVKLGANLDIYWPNWATATTLPNNADQTSIYALCQQAKADFITLDS